MSYADRVGQADEYRDDAFCIDTTVSHPAPSTQSYHALTSTHLLYAG